MTITTFEVLNLIGQMLIFMICLTIAARLRIFVAEYVTYCFGKVTKWNFLHVLTAAIDFGLLVLFINILGLDSMDPEKAKAYSAVVSCVFLITAGALYDFMWDDKQGTKLAKFLDEYHLRIVR